MGLKRMDNVGIVVDDFDTTVDFFRDETLERLRQRGAQLVGEVVRYKDRFWLCYIRESEGLLIGLAQELS